MTAKGSVAPIEALANTSSAPKSEAAFPKGPLATILQPTSVSQDPTLLQ